MRMFFRLIRQALRDVSLNPWAQLLTLAAVTLVSFLVGLFLLTVTNLNHQLAVSKDETVFQVYWRPGADQREVTEQWRELRMLPGFAHAKTYTPAEALKELEERIGRGSAKKFPFLSKDNPLPPTALLTFKPDAPDYERWLAETTSYLGQLHGVERISSTPLRDELGQAWRKVNSYVMLPAMIFLVLILGLVVGNTVRLSMLAKSQEVEILQLVGAFNWYIRLPLLFTGGLQGFLGSFLALCTLFFVHMQIKNVLNFPPFFFEIQFLPPLAIALMLGVSTLMGVIGGWVGIKR